VVNGSIYAFGGVQTFLHPNLMNTVHAIPDVEAYDPAFQGEGVEAKGKLVRPWGEIKSD
jgi:hypothetical protein